MPSKSGAERAMPDTDTLGKTVYVLVFDGFADWEPAHALPVLRREGCYKVECVGFTVMPVASMG